MISKPFFCLNKLQDGMRPFWKAVAAGEINALYMLCSPTNKNVIESSQLDGENQQEVRVFQWLTRYLRNRDQQSVARFLRFCTGSDVILPHSSIKVRMENMSALSMRPKAQTCFRVLVIPKNYPTQLVCVITWISTYPIHNYGISLIDKTYIQCFNILGFKNWRGILSKQAVFVST